MIKVICFDNKQHEIEVIKFSDGCYNVKVPHITPITISVKIEDSVRDVHLLNLVISAYENLGVSFIRNLYIPYVPNARADRVFVEGNAAPLPTLLDSVNLDIFRQVIIYDPHSDVTVDYFDSHSSGVVVDIVDQYDLVRDHCHSSFDIVCSPDKGAVGKALRVAEDNNVKLIKASKIRDVNSGRILSTELEDGWDVLDKRVLICDDICDGGGTFIPLAKLLKEKGASEVILFVSHGIFAKGLEIFEDCVDKIYTANIVCNYITQHDLQKFNMRKEK